MAAILRKLFMLLACLVLVGAATFIARNEKGSMGLLSLERGRRSVFAGATQFRDRAGPDYQRSVLDEVRRSCPYAAVLRLDEVPPSAVDKPAATEPVAAAPQNDGVPLFDADFTSGGHAGFEAVDGDTNIGADPSSLALIAGQVRTTAELAIEKQSVGTIVIEASTNAPAHLLVGWSDRSDALRLVRNKARIDLIADGRVHTYAIDAAKALERGLDAGAIVRRLFLSARGQGSEPVRISRMRIQSWRHRYPPGGHGVSYEKLGGEMRRVLFQVPTQTLRFDIKLPAQPVFEAGLGVLGRDVLVEFEIALVDAGKSHDLLKRVPGGVGWDDVRVDLRPWASKSVTIQLSVRGSREAVALWSSPVVRSETPLASTPPSIVIVLEDALRADRLAAYGGPVPSPGHDRMASRGVTFERAFAQAPQTRSSVPSLMTSLLPSATGTWDFSDHLREEYVTLAEVLRTCGYQTASFLQNGNAGAYAGLHQGFDVVVDEEQSGSQASEVLDLARGWIEAQGARPSFAYVHVLDPHGPFDPKQRPDVTAIAGEETLDADRAIDPSWLTEPTSRIRRALYDAEVATADSALDAFLGAMQRGGRVERTIVAVMADHGEFLGEHGGMWRHHPPGHLEVLRVPLMLAGPGIPAAKRSRSPVALLDVMPTLLSLVGIDGSSIAMLGRPLIGAGQIQEDTTRIVVSEEPELEHGERTAEGCGSVITTDAHILRACITDEAYFEARTIAGASEHPRPPTRIFELTTKSYAKESPLTPALQSLFDWRTTAFLSTLQSTNIEAWRKMTAAADPTIRTEPETSERLRALGYAQ